MEQISVQMATKANIKDVCALVDIKANADEVIRNMNELAREIEDRVPKEEFQATLGEQSLINEALCGEYCLGRWLWKSGDLINGFCVPWEI